MSFLAPKPKRSMFQLEASDLLCKNSCGFYGNPEWHGLCSKCFREYQKKAEASAAAKKTRTKESLEEQSHSTHRPPLAKPANKQVITTFDKFVNKKKQQSERKSHALKSVFVPSTSAAKDFEAARPKTQRQISSDVHEVVKAFNDFLQTLPKPMAADIARRVQVVANKVLEYSQVDYPIEELSKIVNNFYEEFTERLNRHELYAELSEETISKLLDYSESYIIIRSYKHLFCPPTTDDEEKDLAMQSRVRKLNWVTASRLGAVVDEMNSEVGEAMDSAIADILEVDTRKTVDAKLNSVVSCCRHIAAMLQKSGNGPPSADQFLPAVIFVILRAKPPRMQSNIKFILRFANPNHLRTGEAGYFFTNLCCAMSFIETMDAKSLEMSDDEFQQYMSGDMPSSAMLYEHQSSLHDGLRKMNKNLQILNDMTARQTRLMERMEAEDRSMKEFWASCESRLKECQEKFPLTVKPRRNIFDGSLLDLPVVSTEPLVPLLSIESSTSDLSLTNEPVDLKNE
ncbi:rab5 GDP/GTP exchange factor-like [Paramacrobiotus metropolitanus]|uniref:rab5 GDP/GTP exchange factor-like n=1 Tax=Paramacrobiotus metropolitanus TaxID=2943436 RepID=UPI002445ECB4|nr:rab5 GDP/GTP exchange factor-like [Paramacrobiotus metropolitanus]XP_055328278.1 rab5 GDP/GTP exchange factor-like [Paramacrobiotus metropolitanus]XP_055328279.1 rab5 GDP/GTP exchange factor-like [Paramacrobiotus metropolitanus]